MGNDGMNGCDRLDQLLDAERLRGLTEPRFRMTEWLDNVRIEVAALRARLAKAEARSDDSVVQCDAIRNLLTEALEDYDDSVRADPWVLDPGMRYALAQLTHRWADETRSVLGLPAPDWEKD